MLPSITSLFSTRALSVLPLATCLLGITVIARPIDQVRSGSMALQTSVEKNYHPEIFLQRYFIESRNGHKTFTDSVSLRIGETKPIHRRDMPTKPDQWKLKETKLGNLHFANEAQGGEALVKARVHATEWQSTGYGEAF
ncbi:hypothetical protein C8R42DRAFT_722002 [Lentinula raphanica]|nr:hypothetical protein C8R42DRAFT_722002 [Lentinula raphanica]